MRNRETVLTRPGLYKRQKAAVHVEFLLSAPIFFLFIIALVDFTRYWSTTLILQFGMNQGARLAAKLPDFDHDLNFLDLGRSEDVGKRQRFLASRSAILQEALNFPFSTIISQDRLR